MSLALYSLAYMGTNILFVFNQYGFVASYAQTLYSGGAVCLCKYAGASYTTACATGVVTTTPFLKPIWRVGKTLVTSIRGKDAAAPTDPSI